MTSEERRALLGDAVIKQIRQDVHAHVERYGIPDDLILELRRIFAPAVERLQARRAAEAAASQREVAA